MKKIFISAVSKGLRSYRETVTEIVAAQSFIPIVQEHFQTPQTSIIEEIRDKIFQSKAVIALVGPYYGGTSPIVRDGKRLSYSQYELLYALEYRRPCLVLFTGSEFIPDLEPDGKKVVELPDLLRSQEEFIKLIKGGDKSFGRSSFNDRLGLALALAKHRWHEWLKPDV